MQLGGPEVGVILVFWALLGLVVIWPAGRICMRAGLSPYLGILAVFPFVNVLLLWYVAYADWPASPDQPSTQ